MLRIEEIRSAVDILSSLTEQEWEIIAEIIQEKERTLKKGKIKNFDCNREKYLNKLLKEFGIPTNICGYQYLKKAIIILWDDNTLKRNLVKAVYPKIAEDFNTTPSCVERAIRHAIKVAWRYENFDFIEEVFCCSIENRAKCATNGEVIATLTEYAITNMI